MWISNSDTGKWYKKEDILNKSVYDSLKQDVEKVILYSKYLSGVVYAPINDISNLYNLSTGPYYNWFIGSTYSVLGIPTFSKVINQSSEEEYYQKYVYEYGLTFKNLFTPSKLINDSIKNFVYVDVASTSPILNIGQYSPGLSIDGVSLIENHRVLLTGQVTYVSLTSSIDPKTYFISNYYLSSTASVTSSTTYYYYNQDNGVYIYKNSTLIRDIDIATYSNAYRYSTCVKLGVDNVGKEFHLSRLLNNYYPLYINGDPIEFKEKNNWMLRTQLDYDNIYDINYHSIISHGSQSYNIDNFTYSIPSRKVSVGDFGMILNNQDGISHIIHNKYKVSLNSVIEKESDYWICGNTGTLLRVNKVDFSIRSINVNELNNFTSIQFADSLRGLVVGKFNCIYFTNDGGYTWKNIAPPEFNSCSYNKVIYDKFEAAYIGGENGVFIEMKYINNQWVFYKRSIIKYLDINDPTEEYQLVDDINGMFHSHFTSSNPWNLTYSNTVITQDKDMILIGTNGGNILFYDVNNFIPQYDFTYLSFSHSISDIRGISQISGSSSIYFSSDKIYSIDITNFSLIGTSSNNMTFSASASVVSDIYVNDLFDYQAQELLICGNDSLLLYNGYTSSYFNPIDSTFGFNFKSKLLFLDYDISSKLNFFDSNQNYRLPNSLTFSSIDSQILIQNKPGQLNWINYYKDSDKVFKYYTSMDTSNQVNFSSTFSYATGSFFTFSSSNINIELNGILSLAPNISSGSASRYISGTVSISAPTYSESVFLYKYLIVFKLPSYYVCDVGDVLYIQSDIIETTLLVNRIFVSTYKYIYCYVDFNQTITNQIKNFSGSISITNLNRFAISGTQSSSSIEDNDYTLYSSSDMSKENLLYNFKHHPISIGYNLSTDGSSYYLSNNFNNKTAYYNMQSQVVVDSITYSSSYSESFLLFGFSPTYNLYDYLNNINPGIFTSSKVFTSMPQYRGLPGNNENSFTSSNIYIDTNSDSNKLLFGNNFEFEWKSIWINTFVDVVLYSGASYSTSKLLVMNKYHDKSNNGYVIEFHKKLNFNYGDPITSIDIISRNTLTQISSDLQILNNIQRSSSSTQIQVGSQYNNYKNDLNFKIPTDSYCKILLSDVDIKENLTGIIYVDYKNELSLNLIKLEVEYDIPISSTGEYLTGSNSYLLISCSQSHNLLVGDGVVLSFTGGTGSSEFLNTQYFGYKTVGGVIDQYKFYVNQNFGVTASDHGNINFIKNDPFLNYQPVDIMDIGSDGVAEKSVEIVPDNISLSGSTYSLINVDFNKFRYQLVDGLSILDISTTYQWILQADISNAVIGQDKNGLVWYMGDWIDGRWFGGTWYSGRWITGDWYSGNWHSYNTTYKLLNVEVGSNINDNTSSKWYNGRWFDGTWNGGSWYNGRRYGGAWNGGSWYNGIWNDGNWYDGYFKGGIWVLGNWHGGVFNCDNKPAYWIDGNWYGGDFENGMWYNGQFSQTSGLSRFGTKSFNTRNAIWQAGTFTGGEFHSFLNTINGKSIASEFNKYSIWKTGLWSGGNWYGGIAYAIDFNSGNWYGGVIEEIQIIGIEIVNGNLSQFTLNGNFKFNPGDSIWIVNDNNPTPYSSIGTNLDPGNYKILTQEQIGLQTLITISQDIYNLTGAISVSNIETGLRLTTIFKNSIWKSGVWTNGIFESGYFEGGIWYGGLFLASWGR